MTFTFVCKYNAPRLEKVTSKAPNLNLQVCVPVVPEISLSVLFHIFSNGAHYIQFKKIMHLRNRVWVENSNTPTLGVMSIVGDSHY